MSKASRSNKSRLCASRRISISSWRLSGSPSKAWLSLFKNERDGASPLFSSFMAVKWISVFRIWIIKSQPLQNFGLYRFHNTCVLVDNMIVATEVHYTVNHHVRPMRLKRLIKFTRFALDDRRTND